MNGEKPKQIDINTQEQETTAWLSALGAGVDTGVSGMRVVSVVGPTVEAEALTAVEEEEAAAAMTEVIPFFFEFDGSILLKIAIEYSGSSGGFRDSQRSGGFEEYDAGGDEDNATSTRRSNSTSQRSAGSSRRTTAPAAPAPAPKPKEPEVDLLGGFDDDIPSSATSNSFATNKDLPALSTPAAPAAVAIDGEFLKVFTPYSQT